MKNLYTPRLVRKLINQIEINYKEHYNLAKDKNTFLLASIFVATAQTLNNEELLKKMIHNKEELKKFMKKDFNIAEENKSKYDIFSKDFQEKYNKLAINFDLNIINIDTLFDYINIIFYKEKIPDIKNFFNILVNENNIIEKINKIDNYFSIFSNDILSENLSECINNIIKENKLINKNLSESINIYAELNKRLFERYKISIFIINEKIVDNFLDIIENRYDENNINYIDMINIFYIFNYSNNKKKYKNKIKKLLLASLENNNIITNILLEIISSIDFLYKKNDLINIKLYDLFKDYYFLKDIINDNMYYIIFGFYRANLNRGDVISGSNVYYKFRRLDFLSRRITYDILDKNNINKIINIVLKGYANKSNTIEKISYNNNINFEEVFIDSKDIWNLIFIDIYKCNKLNINQVNQLIKIGVNDTYSNESEEYKKTIETEEQIMNSSYRNEGLNAYQASENIEELNHYYYISYLIALDTYYKCNNNIIDVIIDNLKPKNYINIFIIAINKYKDNNTYIDFNKIILNNILDSLARNFNISSPFELGSQYLDYLGRELIKGFGKEDKYLSDINSMIKNKSKLY